MRFLSQGIYHQDTRNTKGARYLQLIAETHPQVLTADQVAASD